MKTLLDMIGILIVLATIAVSFGAWWLGY